MKHRSLQLLALLGTLVLAACGGDDGDDGDNGNPTPDSGNGGNTAPTADFSMDPTCTSPPDHTSTFTSTSTDPDGDTLTCSWTFNSGTPSTSSDCTVEDVSFPGAAPYAVTLMVDDGNGGTDSVQMDIARCP